MISILYLAVPFLDSLPKCRLLPNSFDVLRMAADMKRSGELPSCLSLVAAENPLLDPASRLERKVAGW